MKPLRLPRHTTLAGAEDRGPSAGRPATAAAAVGGAGDGHQHALHAGVGGPRMVGRRVEQPAAAVELPGPRTGDDLREEMEREVGEGHGAQEVLLRPHLRPGPARRTADKTSVTSFKFNVSCRPRLGECGALLWPWSAHSVEQDPRPAHIQRSAANVWEMSAAERSL